MPRPSTQRQLLSLPFRTGLSQKQDQRWLDPGAMLTAQNAVKLKANTLQKRIGLSRLPIGTSWTVGRSVGTIQGSLYAIAKDTWTDALWTYSTDTGAWGYVDRVPEVYALPDRTVFAQNGVIREFDTAVANGVEVHVALVSTADGFNTNNSTGIIYFCAIDATTRQYILPPQPMQLAPGFGSMFAQFGTDYAAPKLIVQGRSIVFGAIANAPQGGLPSIYLATLDSLAPQFGFGAALVVTPLLPPGAASFSSVTGKAYTLLDLGTWDMCPTPGDTSRFGVVYQQNAGAISQAHITLDVVQCATPTGVSAPGAPTIAGSTNIETNDPQYVSDNPGGPIYLTAMALDIQAPFGGGVAAVSYAYEINPNGSGYTPRLHLQTINWGAGLTPQCAAIDCIGLAPGPLTTVLGALPKTLRLYPHAIALAYNGVAPFAGYVIAMAPASSVWEATPTSFAPVGTAAAKASAFTIKWWIKNTGSSLLMQTNQPRMTVGIVPASRWLPNINSLGYIMGRLVSDEQGTYYLFADDAWSDATIGTSQLGQNGGGWYPLRHVATFAPRLSSVLFQPNEQTLTAPYQQVVVPYLQDQFINGANVSGVPNIPQVGNFPHSLPHICGNASAAGISVFQTLISVSGNNQSQSPTVVQWDMQSPLAYQSASLGKNTGIATGAPSVTDGSRVHEFAMPYVPSIVTAAPYNTVGGGIQDGTSGAPNVYQYIAIYDWPDSAGQLHRSGRSAPRAAFFPGANNNACQVAVSVLGFTGKEKAMIQSTAADGGASPQQQIGTLPVTIRLYRTQANGELYYEVGAILNFQQGTITGSAVDNCALFADTSNDVQIGTNRLLYDQGLDGEAPGSILDHLTPPAFQCMCVHKNRFFGVDGNNVWASQEIVDGEGAGFNEAAAFSWYDGPTTIAAIASMDDKLIIWKSDRIGYITGEGPEDDGGQNDWSPVQPIATDVGCVDWRSVVVTPQGAYFMSAAGYRLLTRDLQVVPVPDVEDIFNGASASASGPPTVTSNVLHPTGGRIVTTVAGTTDDMTQPGTIIAKDYVLDSWTTSVDSRLQSPIAATVARAPTVSFTPGGPAVGGTTPAYTWIAVSGLVYQESLQDVLGQYLDVGQYSPLDIETAWIRAEGIEGFARFRRLQVVWQNADPHALSVFVAYDYTPTYYLLGVVTATQMLAMQNNPICQQLFSLPRQRAESVRFKVTDSQDGVVAPVTGQGPVLLSMGLEVTRYTSSRTNRLPATQRT